MLPGTLWTDNYNTCMFYFTTQYQHAFRFSGNRGRWASEKLQVRCLLLPWVFHLLFSFRGRTTLWAPGLLLPPLLRQCDLSLANTFWALIFMMVMTANRGSHAVAGVLRWVSRLRAISGIGKGWVSPVLLRGFAAARHSCWISFSLQWKTSRLWGGGRWLRPHTAWLIKDSRMTL